MRLNRHQLARRHAAALTAAVMLPLTIGTSTAVGQSPPSWTAVTAVTSRPAAGNHDNQVQGVNHTWADASFTRSTTVSFYGQVGSEFCPGIKSGECYYWIGEALDVNGRFTTNPTAASGAYSPGNGTGGTGANGPFPIGTAATGQLTGRYHYGFYTNVDAANTALVPSAENDHGTLPLAATTSTCTGGSSCGMTNCQWVEQFFPHGTQFWDLTGDLDPSCLGLYGSWFYYLPPGADQSCSLEMSKWATATWNNFGTDPVDGNIFAPDAAHC